MSRPGRRQSAARRGGRGCRLRHRRSRRVLDNAEHSAMLTRDWDAITSRPRRGYRPAKKPLIIGGESPPRCLVYVWQHRAEPVLREC